MFAFLGRTAYRWRWVILIVWGAALLLSLPVLPRVAGALKVGGFSSPNKNVDPEVYPDPITKKTATDLANAEVFRFDMSDLMPGAFGSDALFTLLQDFLKNPDDVAGIQKKLEAAAKSAFKSS